MGYFQEREARVMNWWKKAEWDPVKDGKYSDGEREWSISSVIRHAEGVEAVSLDVEELLEKNGETETKEGRLGDLVERPTKEFRERCERADLRYPILVDGDGWLIDGAHRLVKAKWEKREKIEAKRIDMSEVEGGRKIKEK